MTIEKREKKVRHISTQEKVNLFENQSWNKENNLQKHKGMGYFLNHFYTKQANNHTLDLKEEEEEAACGTLTKTRNTCEN